MRKDCILLSIGVAVLLSAFTACKKDEPQTEQWKRPVVTIESITNGSSSTTLKFEDQIKVAVAASTTDGFVKKVDLYMDDEEGYYASDFLVASLSASPYTFVLQPGTVAAGDHIIKVVAYDDANVMSAPAIQNITVKATTTELPASMDFEAASLPSSLYAVGFQRVAGAGRDGSAAAVASASGDYMFGSKKANKNADILEFYARGDFELQLAGKAATPYYTESVGEWTRYLYGIYNAKARAIKWVAKDKTAIDDVLFTTQDSCKVNNVQAADQTYSTATITFNVDINDTYTLLSEAGVSYGVEGGALSTSVNTKDIQLNGAGSYTFEITGLQSDATYKLQAYAVQAGTKIKVLSDTLTFATTAAPKDVLQVTKVEGAVGGASATLHVELDGAYKECGVCYGTSKTPTVNDEVYAIPMGITDYKVTVALNPGSTYYFRAYVIRNVKGVNVVSYGDAVSFNNIDHATCYLNSEVAVQSGAASLMANFAAGKEEITKRGVCLGLNANPTMDDKQCFVQTTTMDDAEITFNQLEANTHYYARAFVQDKTGTYYSEQVDFYTNSLTVGDFYKGGIIATLNGNHGLILYQETIGDAYWLGTYDSRKQTVFCNATDADGSVNTATIVKEYGLNIVPSDGSYAALLCDQFSAEGYDDWFLPSISELNAIAEEYLIPFSVLSGKAKNYWTSSEIDGSTVYVLNISSTQATQMTSTKANTKLPVFAVRKF